MKYKHILKKTAGAGNTKQSMQ